MRGHEFDTLKRTLVSLANSTFLQVQHREMICTFDGRCSAFKRRHEITYSQASNVNAYLRLSNRKYTLDISPMGETACPTHDGYMHEQVTVEIPRELLPDKLLNSVADAFPWVRISEELITVRIFTKVVERWEFWEKGDGVEVPYSSGYKPIFKTVHRHALELLLQEHGDVEITYWDAVDAGCCTPGLDEFCKKHNIEGGAIQLSQILKFPLTSDQQQRVLDILNLKADQLAA